jgi:hypothetical protein
MPLPSVSRPDLSPHVIHFTKATDSLDVFEVLLRIIEKKTLRGSTGFVKGGSTCISFTEAPLQVLGEGLSRYSGFGLRFRKAHIFQLGGRPVIYQSDSEFDALPQSLRWRHVRFESASAPPIDWTWEREWRLPHETLPFTEEEIDVVVPDESAAERFRLRIERESFYNAWAWEVVLGEIAWAYEQPNPWRILHCKPSEPPPPSQPPQFPRG